MKKFSSLLIAVVVLGVGYQAFSAPPPSTVGSGNLQFYANGPNGAGLTPVVEYNSVDYGFYNLAGEPINADGTSRVADDGAPNQSEILDAFGQYNASNATIIVPVTP
jgi:hypothetical protein